MYYGGMDEDKTACEFTETSTHCKGCTDNGVTYYHSYAGRNRK